MDLSRETIQKHVVQAENNVVDVEELFAIAHQLLEEKTERKTVHAFLNLGHLPAVNSSIAENNRIDDWLSLLIELIDKSKYSFGHLFYNRSRKYKHKHLFHEFQKGKVVSHSYEDIWEELLKAAGALTHIEKSYHDKIRIGILTPNCLRGAIVDLTCISFHFPVIPIPANETKKDIDFIIKHSGVTHLFVDNELKTEINDIFLPSSNDLNIINLNNKDWQTFIEQGQKSDPLEVLKRIGRVRMDEVATIMYTSGTTGEPKGITFSQRNMIVKRFARALALTKFGSHDSFLCYLPLYHTFGRFLELQGSIFWGASYAFAEDSSYDTLRKNFLFIKPTVLISVPKRWTQLYETIQSLAADHLEEDRIVRKAIKKVTGGNLKWGLSAAGYLDPDIFQFFQNNDIQLLSGYGMTEATGGITLTSPDEYVVDSVGQKLPGIELRISDEGELLLKGPYISAFYYADPLTPSTDDGWFHTGDIFIEKDGHYFIKDRKKEIYKNTAGQTLTPQKIENMLSEFDAIQSAFLVGDNMDFNTVLIFPDEDYLNFHIPEKEPAKIKSAISALIQSVNGFLAPYERIINFGIISRDFNAEYDELTQKGTFKRQNILANWDAVIKPMYAPNHADMHHKGKSVSFPNWLLKEMKIAAHDISWSGRYLRIETLDRKCRCQWENDTLLLGEFEYSVRNDNIDMGRILMDPNIWLGNSDLAIFFGEIVFQLLRYKQSSNIEIQLRKTSQPILTDIIKPAFHETATIEDLHLGTMFLIQTKKTGLEYYNQILQNTDLELKKIGVEILINMLNNSKLKFSRSIFNTLIPFLKNNQFVPTLKRLFIRHQLNKKLRSFSIEFSQLDTHHIEELITELTTQRTKTELTGSDQVYIRMLMNQLTILTQSHPSQYYHIRHELTCWKLLSPIEALNQTTANSVITLAEQFKEMIGDVEIQSVDKETGSEYSWTDLIEFDKTIEHEEQKLLLKIFRSNPIVKESIFIMTGFKLTHLGNIQKKGIWITPLTTNLQIQQYRILMNLKDGKAYNIILYHIPKSIADNLESMIEWQIVKSEGLNFKRITNNFLCSFTDSGIIISEYEPKANVDSLLRSYHNELNNPKLRDRWDMRWLHFGWSGFQGYINHWALSNYKYVLLNPSMNNVIISEFDNSTNVRIKHSLLQEPVTSNLNVIILLYEELIIATEKRFKGLNRVLYWEIVFTCILQAAGKEKGLEILNLIAHELEDSDIYELNKTRLIDFIDEVVVYGYIPKSVIFAALRFQRWMDLNPDALIEDQFDILQELYHDYKLNNIYTIHPEVRLRYFLLTCFVDHESFIAQRLFELSSLLHHKEITINELETNIHGLVNDSQCSKEQAYFLTRLIYHHVEAADYAELISSTSGQNKLDLVVNLKNKDGAIFSIRPPFKPKEIAQFHDLLLSYNLNAQFGEEHDFLIMFSANKTQVGGVFWKMIDEQIAHIEKIAIHEKFLNCGLGEMLMNEISQRVKKGGAKFLTVGFMKMEYFQRFGFESDESIAGLIKKL